MRYGQINADIGFPNLVRMLMTYFDIDADGYRTASVIVGVSDYELGSCKNECSHTFVWLQNVFQL